MECGFLAGNIILTLACIGIVAVLREIYLAVLWKRIASCVAIKFEICKLNYHCREIAREYIKWASINAQICDENDDDG